MKKVLLLAGVAVLGACSDAAKSGPEDVARKFTEGLAHGKMDDAKSVSTESTKKMLDLMGSMGGMPVTPNYAFKMNKDSVVGDAAWVMYTNEKGNADTLQLVKTDGKWLVQTKK